MHYKTYLENLTALGLLAIILINLTAYFFQFYYHELPCPLCLLQRLGILMAGFGLVMNLRYGFKSSHYAYSMLAIIFAGAVAARQILLHIIPGTGAYGLPFLGLHLYTWVFLAAVAWVLYCTFMLLFTKQFASTPMQIPAKLSKGHKIICSALFMLIVLNAITAFLLIHR